MSGSRDGVRIIQSSSRRRNKGKDHSSTLRRKSKESKYLKRHSHHASPSRCHHNKEVHRRRDGVRSSRRQRHSVHCQHPQAPPAVHHHLHEHHHIHHRDLDASDSEIAHHPFRPKLSKPRGLAINLGAAPLRTKSRNERKARSKPAANTVDAAMQNQRPFDLISYSKLQPVTTSSQRFKKRISAPILLPTSKTGDSSISGTMAMQMETVLTSARTPTLSTHTPVTPLTPMTPYYHNLSARNSVNGKKMDHFDPKLSAYPSTSAAVLRQCAARDSVDQMEAENILSPQPLDGEGDTVHSGNGKVTVSVSMGQSADCHSASGSPSASGSGSGSGALAEEEKEDSFIVARTTNSSTNSRETTRHSIRKPREQSIIQYSSSRKSMTDDDVDGDEGSGTMDSDDYLDEAEINAMIRSFRRISKSGTRPRAYSKTRRISQKLLGLMESLSSSVDQEAALQTVCDALSAQKATATPTTERRDRERTKSHSNHRRQSMNQYDPGRGSELDDDDDDPDRGCKEEGVSVSECAEKRGDHPDRSKRERERERVPVSGLPTVSGHDYRATLRKYGYIEVRVIAKSLQGIVIEAARDRGHGVNESGGGRGSEKEEDETVIIKMTNRVLHLNRISNKHGKSLSVQEDIIKEKKLLMYLTANNPPPSLVRFLGFFSDPLNYYLVMENGGSDFFDWIVQCHQWIRDGKLSLKQWKLYIHDLMVQIADLVQWLHCEMNVCHLDISLENMLIKGNKFKSDGKGGIRLSRKMQIKICDFGLAEFFDPKVNAQFICRKYVGKTHYKAPKVYGKKEAFDARKADMWSLGVSFFMMMIGAPPYKLPLSTDDHFPFIEQGDVMAILKRWGRSHYIGKEAESLLNGMLQINEGQRMSVRQLQHHSYFRHNRPSPQLQPTTTRPMSSSRKRHSLSKKIGIRRDSKSRSNKRDSHSSRSAKRRDSHRHLVGGGPVPPVHSARMAQYRGDGALMESGSGTGNGSGSGGGNGGGHRNSNNIFQHLVMSDDDGQLFRYRTRKLTST